MGSNTTRLRISVLGSPVFERDGAPIAPDTRKASALIAYLAVEGATRRDTLAALLWPESPDSRARATLRRTLSSIRTAAGSDVIAADRDQVTLTDMTHSDVGEFRSAIAEPSSHEHGSADVCSRCIPSLDRAVNLYRGDFMTGFSLRGTPEFEDWVRTTAEELRLACGRAFDNLGSAHVAAGDYRRAISAINSWVDLEPLREPAYRRLMLLNAWAGDRAGAIEAYRRCVATFDHELGVDPLEETTELHEAILDDDLPPAPSLRRSVEVKSEPIAEPPTDLLDRVTELSTLLHAVQHQGDGRIIRLAGDPWMGKTRLLDELVHAAKRQGRTLARARAYHTESRLPYGVVRQLLDSLTSDPAWQDRREEAPEWVLVEAARVYPPLGTHPEAITHDDALGETRLFDALYALLTTGSPVLAVDDAQWADPASLSFLAYLARRLGSTSSLLVFSHRLDESGAIAPLVEAIQDGPTTHLVLDPLTSEEIAPYVPDEIDPIELAKRSGGVPALVTEALQAPGSESTPGIRRFMDLRIAGLDELARQVMASAAVLDGAATIDLVQATSGRTEEEVTTALEELVARRILSVDPEGDLNFLIDSMGRLVYEQISLMRRRLLHRRAATALESLPGARREAGIASTIAQHLRIGGQESDAAGWYGVAADLARGIFASTEAIDAYEAALALGHPEPTRIRLSLGDTLLLAGRFTDALTEFQKAVAHAEGPERALAEHRIGEAQRRLGRFDMALTQFESAQQGHPDPASLHSDWALALLRVGDRRGAREQADRAVVASQESDDAGRSRALAVLGMVTPHRAEAEKVLREALKLAGDDPVLRMGALNALAFSLTHTGKDAEAVALIEEALAIAERIGDRHRRGALFNHLADLHHRAGRDSEAERALTEAVKLLVEIEPGSWQPEVWLLTNW